jgi:hypothetical protein
MAFASALRRFAILSAFTPDGSVLNARQVAALRAASREPDHFPFDMPGLIKTPALRTCNQGGGGVEFLLTRVRGSKG